MQTPSPSPHTDTLAQDQRAVRPNVNKFSLSKVLFSVSCLVLAFGYGFGSARFEVFPYRILEGGIDGLVGVVSDGAIALGLRHTDHAAASRYRGAGTTINKTELQAPGPTLLAGFFDGRNEVRLVRSDNSVIHRWTPRFFEAFPQPDHILPSSLVPHSENNVEVHGVVALPDGSVVLNFDGHGLVKLDRCSGVQWTVPRMTHHALSRASDGGFWVPSFRYVERDSPYPVIRPPFREPSVLHIGPDGAVRQEIFILDLLFRNNLGALLFANGMRGTQLANKLDLTHLNDVEELDASMAAAFPLFRPGSLLLSLRDYNLVVVADPQTMKIEWHQVGPWIGQHDPDFLEDGRISIFDNNNDNTEDGSLGGGSRIIEVDPSTGLVTTRYGGSAAQALFTNIMGQHEHAGQNILIAETRAGRALEVTAQGETVWEFINRVDDQTVSDVTGAWRYPSDYFTVADWRCP
jgi:hypothetical protein